MAGEEEAVELEGFFCVRGGRRRVRGRGRVLFIHRGREL